MKVSAPAICVRMIGIKARNNLHIMELRQKDAMIAYLEAQLELRDAWMDDKDLDMEQYMAEMDAVYASGSEA